MHDIKNVEQYLTELQTHIISALQRCDTALKIRADRWQRPEGGGGHTQVLTGGEIFEKAGVNFSHVQGNKLPPSATAQRPQLSGKAFQAMGVSVVVHPLNPYIPTTHLNVRFFIAGEGNSADWWFGGGFDLTPYYPFAEDVIHWHRTAYKACQDFGSDTYDRYKKWCDEYFYLPHRQEPRGVGGLFYDDLQADDFDHCFAFTRSVGDHFLPAYMPIAEKRKAIGWGERERNFQAYRRGRYAEFNLVYDRGTLFGLQSGGRTESILMSLPPVVHWHYDWQPEAGTPEAELYEKYLVARDWLGEERDADAEAMG